MIDPGLHQEHVPLPKCADSDQKASKYQILLSKSK